MHSVQTFQVESGCRPLACKMDVGSLSCGYFQIKHAYWTDCGSIGGSMLYLLHIRWFFFKSWLYISVMSKCISWYVTQQFAFKIVYKFIKSIKVIHFRITRCHKLYLQYNMLSKVGRRALWTSTAPRSAYRTTCHATPRTTTAHLHARDTLGNTTEAHRDVTIAAHWPTGIIFRRCLVAAMCTDFDMWNDIEIKDILTCVYCNVRIPCLWRCVHITGLWRCVYMTGLWRCVHPTGLWRCVHLTGLWRCVHMTGLWRCVHITGLWWCVHLTGLWRGVPMCSHCLQFLAFRGLPGYAPFRKIVNFFPFLSFFLFLWYIYHKHEMCFLLCWVGQIVTR